MKIILFRTLNFTGWIGALSLLLAVSAQAALTLPALPNGDCQYSWNSKYGPSGYTAGGNSIGVYLYFGAPYGNDYTVGILEIPISSIIPGSLTAASLNVYSNGFGTGYYYGSADIRWIAPTIPLTGNPVTDDVGSLINSSAGGYELWDSSRGQGAGWFSFDVTANVQADLDAGRGFSTFVLNGSRETSGSIRTAEYTGFGAYIVATVPEPSSTALLGLGGLALLRRRR